MTRWTVRYNQAEHHWEVVNYLGVCEYTADTRIECDAVAITLRQEERDNAPPSEGPRRPMDVKFYGGF